MNLHNNVINSSARDHRIICIITNLFVEEGGKGVGGGGGLDLFEGVLGSIDVASGIGKVVVDADALTVLVEDVGHTAGKETEGGLGDLEGLADLIPLIGKDGEVEAKLRGELLLRLNILSRDANNICFSLMMNKLEIDIRGKLGSGCARNDP